MEHCIAHVAEGSPAYRRGLRAGDTLLSLNGEEVLDQIDYQALSARRHILLDARKADGRVWHVELVKREGQPLGLSFGESMAAKPRVCRNHCVFCFIDQMPPGMRDTLYVKDDDWRMSLLMGNYITLTNVNDAEFARMLRRKASPMYISVHAADPQVRVQMMRNPDAAKLMPRLYALRDAGLRFHCQIVLCPGLNDGDVLEDTLTQLTALYPAAQSAALVPVGLTRYREGLYPLAPYTRAQAQQVLAQCDRWQQACLARLGTRFVFPADEMLCVAGRDLPAAAAYEDFPQLENGVGLLRSFYDDLLLARAEGAQAARPRRVLLPCGVSIAPVMEKWLAQCAPQGLQWRVQPIVNHFFGETVTVTGLLTGRDILSQIKGLPAEEILLCADTLRSAGDTFLDDLPLADFRAALTPRVTVVPNNGAAFYQALVGAT